VSDEIPYTALCANTSEAIGAVPLNRCVGVTHRGTVIATLWRPVMRAHIPDGLDVVQIAEMRAGRDERAELLRGGGRFVIASHGRRIAVVEGVSPSVGVR